MARRENDFYQTPSTATEALIKYCPELLSAFEACEPCAGDGAISDVLKRYYRSVRTLDIDPARGHIVQDAKSVVIDGSEAVITNPPFIEGIEIVRNIVEQFVPAAFLLRLSFLEPTEKDKEKPGVKDRGPWLADNPPRGIIVLPRISFTGDGKTDSVTCAWMCWNVWPFGIKIISKEEMRQIATKSQSG